jgi:methylmalonyl-CoA/ethylmalonyl-CoA epimerase
VKGVHHLGVAVEDLDLAISSYERLFGAALEGRETQDDQGVEAASLHVGDGRVELLAALGPDTPVGRFLSRRGPGMHHVAYEVDDLPAELVRLEGAGARLIDTSPRAGLFGMQVAFVHPDAVHGVLSELVQHGGTHGSPADPLLHEGKARG